MRCPVVDRTGQGPFRGPTVTVDEVLVFLIADIGDPGEAGGESVANLRFTDEALTPAIRSPWPLEDGVVGEMGKDPIEVVRIE